MKQHILVVDDESPIRDLLTTFFTKRGYQVSAAASAADGQRLAKELSPDLIILDIALAEADGLELLATLKREHPMLPIIMLTGMGYDDELLQEALQKGAAGYVSKTLPLEQLLMEVYRTLKHPSPQA